MNAVFVFSKSGFPIGCIRLFTFGKCVAKSCSSQCFFNVLEPFFAFWINFLAFDIGFYKVFRVKDSGIGKPSVGNAFLTFLKIRNSQYA